MTFGISSAPEDVAFAVGQKIFYRVISLCLRGRRDDLRAEVVEASDVVSDLQKARANVQMKIRVADMRKNQRGQSFDFVGGKVKGAGVNCGCRVVDRANRMQRHVADFVGG